MKKIEETIAKILEQAASERKLGHIEAANNHEDHADNLRLKYKLKPSAQKKLSAAEIAAEDKREFDAWLDKQPGSTQVIVWSTLPGLSRRVQRLEAMGAVRSKIKCDSRLFVSLANGTMPPPSKSFRDHIKKYGTGDGHNPLPPPMTNEQLAKLREQGRSGTVPAEQSGFTAHEVDDRGKPYAVESERRKNRPWWHGIFFD
jgi:hypothetical protein